LISGVAMSNFDCCRFCYFGVEGIGGHRAALVPTKSDNH
jgi:hypothetical protein